MTRVLAAALVLVGGIAGGRLEAKLFLSQEEALRLAFGDGTKVERRPRILTRVELESAAKLAGGPVTSELWPQYVATRDGTVVGTAYFDTHLVRTLPETLLVVVSPDGTVKRVEVVAFGEPTDYLPKPAWFAQFTGRPLDPELDTKRAIRSVSGATLSARAAAGAVRRVLAVHSVLSRGAKAEASP